jgi:hypothetical protein
MTTTHHLLLDLHVRKASLKRNFDSIYTTTDEARQVELEPVRALLAAPGQLYSLDEITQLFDWLWTSHDDCVIENPDDYTPLEVYTATQKIERGEAALARLESLKAHGLGVIKFDGYLRERTGFRDFDSLLNAKGDYAPTIAMGPIHEITDTQVIRHALADAYDAAQAQRGDPRRAFRS